MSKQVAKSPLIYRCNPLPELAVGQGVCLVQHFEGTLLGMTLRRRAQRWLRHVLAAYLFLPADQLTIARTRTGKPWLPQHSWLRFNLTHSGASAAIVLCRGQDVGVDLEKVSGKIAVKKAIAQRFFHPDEQRWLACSDENYLRRFTQIWCIKEAWLKARGSGLTQPLSGFCVIPRETGLAQVVVEQQDHVGLIHHRWLAGEDIFCLAYGVSAHRQHPLVKWQVYFHQTGSHGATYAG
ncbi:4'-phosphopantetheinyl transferase superfamily protein [Sodalis ligni]|uniref:4'-phosphopantetheinyl transferase family protein n=1 Tax=Sodalis ligni TaxID=2697027 RepID=UPI00193F5409|nr:4'-phosphopantetheinyl transferase superfamily protein [Sodalis ligni]QWA13214.1 4'-phosphopantetheinyl transferase superfamily protein [Sodalis ligni]